MRTIAATSSGSPRRPIGGGAARCAGRAGTPGSPRWLSIVPGTTQFTVMCCGARSSASALVVPARPDYAAMTCARPVAPRWPVRPPMLITVPLPDFTRCGRQACVQTKAASSVLEMTRRQSSSVICSKGASMRTAALLTSASMRPKRATVSSTIAATARGSVTSAMCTAALPPACSIIATVSSACAREVFAFTITAAPPAASARAMARPMLRAPPVTSATFPVSSLPAVIPTLDMRLLVTDRRQPGGERRKEDDDHDEQQHAGDEGHAGEVDVAHRGAGRRHPFHHEEQQPEGRRGVADLERKQHDEAEPGEVEAQRLRQGKEDRRRKQHHGELVHEAAQEEDHADHDPQHAHR